jgi:hypothetical protein
MAHEYESNMVNEFPASECEDELAALRARIERLEGVVRMLISCVEDASVLAFDDELEAARKALEEE